MKKGSYKHLNEHDRVRIEVYLRESKSQYEIAGLLKVHKSTISREIKKRGAILSGYCASYAQKDYERERSKCGTKSIIETKSVGSFVIEKIKEGWSPETIEGRLKLEIKEGKRDKDDYVNYESIYQFIHESQYGKREKLFQYLKQGKKRRTRKWGRKTKHEIIKNRVFIDKRPSEIDKRKTIGHWEGDAIIYPHKYAIQSIVERKLKITLLTKMIRKTADNSTTAFIEKLKNYYTKSLTIDNGSENKDHEKIAKELGIDVYFCHPYSSWEKGTNENTNGLVRRYFPRGTELELVTQRDLNDIAWELNNRPRKTLGFKTPWEMLELEYSKQQLSVNVALNS